jgi:hypothetical protein
MECRFSELDKWQGSLLAHLLLFNQVLSEKKASPDIQILFQKKLLSKSE